MRTSIKNIVRFRAKIRRYYKTYRRSFPWRNTHDPYRILVSEVMLQQTQTSRVKEKYPAFIKQFPTARSLADSTTSDVLTAWSGLGYNRRALFLKQAAEITIQKFNGRIPDSYDGLRTLPGVGHGTASAVLAFAYGIAVPFIETNIRSVFIHHFFPNKRKVSDKEILPLVAASLDTRNPRNWYYALMDYGVMLKEKNPNPSRRSAQHHKQSRFEGSHRQVRGMILKALLLKPHTEKRLVKTLKRSVPDTAQALKDLAQEGFIKREKALWRIA